MLATEHAESPAGIRMAELSRVTGVSVSTIKFYLREGLVQQGRLTNSNQALYDESHIERIRLVRSLSKIAQLPLSTIGEVLKSVDDGGNLHKAMGKVQGALVGEVVPEAVSSEVQELLDAEIKKQGWMVHKESEAYRKALNALQELSNQNLSSPMNSLSEYAAGANRIAETDIATLDGAASATDLIRMMALGTTLRSTLTDALIFLAQQHHSAKHFGAPRGE